MQFISQYSPEDIVTAQIEGSSGALWRISPPSRAQMKQELYNGTADITLRFTWNFQRWVLFLRGLGDAPHRLTLPAPQEPGQGWQCGVHQREAHLGAGPQQYGTKAAGPTARGQT